MNKRSALMASEIEASGKTPLQFLVACYRNTKEDKKLRVEAAKAAAPFVHAKLAVTEVKDVDPNEDKSSEELFESIRLLAVANPDLLPKLRGMVNDKQE